MENLMTKIDVFIKHDISKVEIDRQWNQKKHHKADWNSKLFMLSDISMAKL